MTKPKTKAAPAAPSPPPAALSLTPLHVELLRWMRTTKVATEAWLAAWAKTQIPPPPREVALAALKELVGPYLGTETRKSSTVYLDLRRPIPVGPLCATAETSTAPPAPPTRPRPRPARPGSAASTLGALAALGAMAAAAPSAEPLLPPPPAPPEILLPLRPEPPAPAPPPVTQDEATPPPASSERVRHVPAPPPAAPTRDMEIDPPSSGPGPGSATGSAAQPLTAVRQQSPQDCRRTRRPSITVPSKTGQTRAPDSDPQRTARRAAEGRVFDQYPTLPPRAEVAAPPALSTAPPAALPPTLPPSAAAEATEAPPPGEPLGVVGALNAMALLALGSAVLASPAALPPSPVSSTILPPPPAGPSDLSPPVEEVIAKVVEEMRTPCSPPDLWKIAEDIRTLTAKMEEIQRDIQTLTGEATERARKDQRVVVFVTDAQKETLEQAALAKGVTLSAWVLGAALAASAG